MTAEQQDTARQFDLWLEEKLSDWDWLRRFPKRPGVDNKKPKRGDLWFDGKAFVREIEPIEELVWLTAEQTFYKYENDEMPYYRCFAIRVKDVWFEGDADTRRPGRGWYINTGSPIGSGTLNEALKQREHRSLREKESRTRLAYEKASREMSDFLLDNPQFYKRSDQ